MKLRIRTLTVYDGCIPLTAFMVQKYIPGRFFGKWVNIKGFTSRRKAEELIRIFKVTRPVQGA